MNVSEKELIIDRNLEVLQLFDREPEENEHEDVKKFLKGFKITLEKFGLKRIPRPYKITEDMLLSSDMNIIHEEGNIKTNDPRKHHIVTKEVQVGIMIDGVAAKGAIETKTIRFPKYNTYIYIKEF